MIRFASIPLDKWAWHPSPLVCQVVLVGSVDATGIVDIAPKSNCAVAAFDPLTYGFGCQRDHQTCRNIIATGEFTINIPTVEQADAVWAMVDVPAADRLATTGLTTVPGKTVAVPVIEQCACHLCTGSGR